MQTSGVHGAYEGVGRIRAERNGKSVEFEYQYRALSDREFHGSISEWNPTNDGMGLIAYMSLPMPTLQAMMDWIFRKAQDLSIRE
jgi:hypothetical protein